MTSWDAPHGMYPCKQNGTWGARFLGAKQGTVDSPGS